MYGADAARYGYVRVVYHRRISSDYRNGVFYARRRYVYACHRRKNGDFDDAIAQDLADCAVVVYYRNYRYDRRTRFTDPCGTGGNGCRADGTRELSSHFNGCGRRRHFSYDRHAPHRISHQTVLYFNVLLRCGFRRMSDVRRSRFLGGCV